MFIPHRRLVFLSSESLAALQQTMLSIIARAREFEIDEGNYFVSMTGMMVVLAFIFIIKLMYFVPQFQDIIDHMTGADRKRAEIAPRTGSSCRLRPPHFS
jgi:hypothetical protein